MQEHVKQALQSNEEAAGLLEAQSVAAAKLLAAKGVAAGKEDAAAKAAVAAAAAAKVLDNPPPPLRLEATTPEGGDQLRAMNLEQLLDYTPSDTKVHRAGTLPSHLPCRMPALTPRAGSMLREAAVGVCRASVGHPPAVAVVLMRVCGAWCTGALWAALCRHGQVATGSWTACPAGLGPADGDLWCDVRADPARLWRPRKATIAVLVVFGAVNLGTGSQCGCLPPLHRHVHCCPGIAPAVALSQRSWPSCRVDRCECFGSPAAQRPLSQMPRRLALLRLRQSARRLQEATFEASLAGEGVMELLCMHYGRVLLYALGPISEAEAKLKEAEKAEDEARRLCAPGPSPLCCAPYCHRPWSLVACMPCIRWYGSDVLHRLSQLRYALLVGQSLSVQIDVCRQCSPRTNPLSPKSGGPVNTLHGYSKCH